MAFTVSIVVVGFVPALVCSAIQGARNVALVNDGLCPVWLGASDVTAGRGRILWPGEGAAYDQPDELYAIARGNPAGSLSVDERRA
jgi:hypothetical protein